MASFVVMERADAERTDGDRPGEAAEFRIVRDRFSFVAFLLPVVWLLWHRLWIEAAAVLAAAALVAWLASQSDYGGTAALPSLAIAVYIGIEGPALRLWALRRRGWRDWGVVEAHSLADAETRYLAESWHEEEPRPQDPPRAAPPAVSRHAGSVPAIGLFSYPGRR